MNAEVPRRGGARAEAAGQAARRYGRTASLLSVAVGVTGFIVYLYFALASHNLDPADYGNVATLWLVVFVTVATLYRPVEQLLSRTIAERHAREGFRGRPLKVAATIQAIVALTVTAICLALRVPIEDELLSGSSTLYWIMVVSIAAYAGTFFARGFFAGHRRFGLYSAVLLSDACTRILFPLAVAVGIASGTTAIALGIVAGPLVSLSFVPAVVAIAWRGGIKREPEPKAEPEPRNAPAQPAGAQGPEFTLAQGSGFAAAVLLIVFSEQLFLSSGALILRVTEGALATAFIFNVLMLARAPIYLFQAVATSLLPHLTRLRYRPGMGGEDAFRLSVRVTVGAVVAFATLVAAVVLIAGPDLMQIAFGDTFSYDRTGLLIVTVGMGFYLTAATLSQAALAQGQARRAAICWIGCAVAYVGWVLTPILDEFRRVEVGFAFASAVLCALLYALYQRPHPRTEDAVRPDSPQEIEARLAAADEAG
jgi:O-antigen/teichoic acid export membrane protein